MLAGHRCHCLLSLQGLLTSSSHWSPCVFFTPSFVVSQCCPLRLFPAALLSTHSTLGETGILLEDRKHLLMPHLMHIFLRAMEEFREKERMARIAHFVSCGFIILLLTNSEFHEACGFPRALVCGEDIFQ